MLAVEMKSLLIGESASRDAAATPSAPRSWPTPPVLRLIHIRTEHLGPEELLVGAKLEFRHDLTLPEVADAIDRVEVLVRADVPAARVLYIEPDISRDQPTAAPVAD